MSRLHVEPPVEMIELERRERQLDRTLLACFAELTASLGREPTHGELTRTVLSGSFAQTYAADVLRRYESGALGRSATLELFPAGDKEFSLAVERLSAQPTHFAVNRGTLSHAIYEGESAVAFLDGGMLKFRVACRAQAGALDDQVPFAVAISVEAGIGSGIAIYDEMRQAVQQAQAVRATAGAR